MFNNYCRGECNGKSGLFPSSFVRIVDSFPGDVPPDGADVRCYLKAQSGISNGKVESVGSTRNHNDYMNTQNAFPNLTESLQALEPKFQGEDEKYLMALFQKLSKIICVGVSGP